MKNDLDLCKWLRDNSSGVYRPSAEAALRIETLKNALVDLLNDTQFGNANELIIQNARDALKEQTTQADS